MCMVSQDKLIKDGIRYTDKLFDEISRRLEKGVLDSDTLEEFLRKTKEYTTNNPLVSTDYDKTMINIILAETNNHKFSRPAQKELVRVTIENKVGDLIRDVGEDIKQSVRDIVTEEYNNPEGSNPQKMAKQISKKVSGIKNKRAKTIARTEIARTATISDYIIASERGATHYTVTCRSTRCPICKKMYCKSSETGGDVEYEITDTSNLPPVHPNCRCSANFIKKPKVHDEDVDVDDVSVQPVKDKTVLSSNNDYEEYTAVDNWYKRKIYGRQYNDGTDIRWDKDTDYINPDQVKAHLETLPQILQDQARKYPIYLEGNINGNGLVSGEFHDYGDKFISLYKTNVDVSLDVRLDSLTHELAHSLEPTISIDNRMRYSNSKAWRDAYTADNKFNSYIHERTGRRKTPKIFASDYARGVYKKRHKNKALHFAEFSEDWADSWKQYVNPKTHDAFIQKYPNRSRIIEGMINTKETIKTTQRTIQKIKVTPEDRGVNPKTSTLRIGDADYPENRLKSVQYNDGTTVHFKKVAYPDSDYYVQTIDYVEYEGNKYKYLGTDSYKHFNYQDKNLSPDDQRFVDEFAARYGSYEGKQLNNYNRGRTKDINEIQWLLDNQERYNQILRESELKGDIVTVRVESETHIPKGALNLKNDTFSSSSVGAKLTDLEDNFGIGQESWKYITIVPTGTRGGRFAGNSIRRYHGDPDADFELEVTWSKHQEFEVVIHDEENHIIILKPK